MEPLPDILHLNTPSQEIEMMIQAVKNMNLSKAFVEVSPFFKEYALYINDNIFISFTLRNFILFLMQKLNKNSNDKV